jgi:hypothetical protein
LKDSEKDGLKEINFKTPLFPLDKAKRAGFLGKFEIPAYRQAGEYQNRL